MAEMSSARANYRIALLVAVALCAQEVASIREQKRAEKLEQPTPHVCQSCNQPLPA